MFQILSTGFSSRSKFILFSATNSWRIVVQGSLQGLGTVFVFSCGTQPTVLGHFINATQLVGQARLICENNALMATYILEHYQLKFAGTLCISVPILTIPVF